MLHHRTQDPAKRAESIAKREAEKVWRLTNGNLDEYWRSFLEIYNQTLAEFVSHETMEEGECFQ